MMVDQGRLRCRSAQRTDRESPRLTGVIHGVWHLCGTVSPIAT